MMWKRVVIFTCFQILHVSSSLLDSATSALPDVTPLVQKIITNEDANLNFTELARKYGYAAETHKVVTEDGYILTMFRLPPAQRCAAAGPPLPLVLMHGLLDSSDTFIVAGPNISLGYLLADACHDVWCPNHRGNRYSLDHITLNHEKDPLYWDFTRDELGARDLPALVDYVLNCTGAAKINYIGHSQGTTDFFILNSVRPEYNDKFNLAICLSPVAWLHHITSGVLRSLAAVGPEIKLTADLVGLQQFGAHGQTLNILASAGCGLTGIGCDAAFIEFTGKDTTLIRRSTLETAFGHFPAGTSVKNLLAYAQGLNKNTFSRYDYGSAEGNQAVYGADAAPRYAVRRVTSRVALVATRGDALSNLRDVAQLRRRLPNVVDYYLIPDDYWSHVHYVYGETIPTVLMPKIHEYLNTYLSIL